MEMGPVVVSHSVVSDCDHTDCSTPGSPVARDLPVFAHTHAHCVSDAGSCKEVIKVGRGPKGGLDPTGLVRGGPRKKRG